MIAPMKILYLTSDFPYPPRGGGALRIMGLVGGAATKHELHLLSFGAGVATQTPLHQLCARVRVIPPPQRSKADRLRTLLFSGKADMQTRSWSAAFLAALRDTLQQTTFDIIQLQSLEMGIYLEPIRRLQPSAKIIYDAYNAEAELQRMVFLTDIRHARRLPLAAYSGVQWRRLRRFERALCQAADGVIAVSDADQVLLQKVAGKTPVWVVNNGIHVQDYATPPTEELPLQKPALIFTGLMDYRPNVDAALWFAAAVFPHIIPNAHFYIVGNRPTPRVQALAAHPRITVTGFVEDVLPYLHAGAVFVVPLRVGSGTRLKLLQAMSANCAIVSTRVGAMGLGATDGHEVLLADDASDFAQAVNGLLADEEKRRALGATAYQFVQNQFDWAVIVPNLLQVYEHLRSISR